MESKTCADVIVESLIAEGVDTIFGIPGAQTYAFFDALARAKKPIRVIASRHEQGAAYMAFGYARSSKKTGVYAVVPGPGVLNTTAALCTAYGCNLPVLCITGEVPSPFIGKGRGHLHELPNQLGTLRTLAKWAERIAQPNRTPEVMQEAFFQMRSGRPGPAIVEVPWDVFGQPAEGAGTYTPPATLSTAVDPSAVASMADVVASARSPMIFVGGGALDAGPEVQALATRLGAPVVAFRSGRGIVSEESEVAANIATAYELWADTDLVIGIGTRLEVPYLRWPYRPDGMKLARIDIDPKEMERLPPDAAMIADATNGTASLLQALESRNLRAESRVEALRNAKAATQSRIAAIRPHAEYLERIRSVLPRDGFFVEELCQAGYVSYYGFPVYSPRTYVSCGYQGTLGFGFMTALGVKVANPDKAVVSISGDGGFMFGVQELATAVQHNIAVVAIVFDNSGFGNVRRDQQQRFAGRVIAADLRNPDFVRLAESFGAAGFRAHSSAELAEAIEKALAMHRPALIHVPVDPKSEVSPWPLVLPRAPQRSGSRT
jgi:acetolactate synthase-1/2/3 large subunit